MANSIRSLRCVGAKPIGIIIKNYYSKNSDCLDKLILLKQGQSIAANAFNLKLHLNCEFVNSGSLSQNISAIGIFSKRKNIISNSFKHTDHFISMVGSYRGELSGSVLEEVIFKNSTNSLFSVDLKMELQIGEVLKIAIENNLIQTATNVGRGGISAAILKNLFESDNELGARIHLTRKFQPQEILFGETQGLVIISIKEEDIILLDNLKK